MNESNAAIQVFPGLRSEPLASYLAGLGLFRLLAEQADPAATAAWTTDGLAISTTVADIARWLVDQYVPTPVLSPWNNGSGFGPKDKEPKRTLDALRGHPSRRLEPFRVAITMSVIPPTSAGSIAARNCSTQFSLLLGVTAPIIGGVNCGTP